MATRNVFRTLTTLLVVVSAIPAVRADEPRAEVIAQARVNHPVNHPGSVIDSKSPSNDGVVFWLTPVNEPAGGAAIPTAPQSHLQLAQKNKQFVPRFLVVQVGSVVDFPNLDPFFHNVFSRFNGKKFDLGLYESGSSRSVHFNRPGVSYIFCNIHPEMSAIVVSVPTPYFAVSSASGSVTIRGVADGTYELHVWALGASDSDLAALSHRVAVSGHIVDLGTITLSESASKTHKNKFEEDYDDKQPPY
jgi:plastocyanin